MNVRHEFPTSSKTKQRNGKAPANAGSLIAEVLARAHGAHTPRLVIDPAAGLESLQTSDSKLAYSTAFAAK